MLLSSLAIETKTETKRDAFFRLAFLIAIPALCAVLTACTSQRVSRNLASGAIGCPPHLISISKETASFDGSHNFEAKCKGQRFICHYHETSGIDCTQALEDSEAVKAKEERKQELADQNGNWILVNPEDATDDMTCIEDPGWPKTGDLLCKPAPKVDFPQ